MQLDCDLYHGMATAGLEVREAGRALRFQTEAPHLVSMGSGRLSTAVTLHPLPEGRVTLGSSRDADIPMAGTGVELIHCAIENYNGVVTLYPVNGNTSIDGTLVNSPVRLAQGCMLSIGRSNYMRFNHPAEAKQLKSVLPNTRISMAPISFSLADNFDNHLDRKPPVAPRKSPRSSCSDDEGFLGKLTKFEMLARQSRNCVSPKVFPAGSITANVPADQILGHSRSSSLASLSKNNSNSSNNNNNSNNNSPFQNLTNLDRSRSSTPGFHCSEDNRTKVDSKTPSRSNTPNFYQTSTPNHNQIQVYSTADTYLKTYKPHCYENNENHLLQGPLVPDHSQSFDLMSRSMICQKSTDFDKFGREFDMSQSLIVAKTTTEYLQVEKFGSNPNLYNHGSNSNLNGVAMASTTRCFGSNPNIRRIQPLSPAFNRNPKYSDQTRTYGRVKSPTPSAGSSCSIEELRERQVDAENKRKEAESRRRQAQEERLREQEVERQEKMRLEEILAMCAEYEKQSTTEKPRQPNRIKTNGSLPRDKRPGYNSPFDSPKSPSKNQPYFSFESPKQNTTYENVGLQNSRVVLQNGDSPNNNRARIYQSTVFAQNERYDPTIVNNQEQLQPTTPNNNQSARWPNGPGSGDHSRFANSITSQGLGSNYENARIDRDHLQVRNETNDSTTLTTTTTTTTTTTFGKIQLNGTKVLQTYENFVPVNGNKSPYENVTLVPSTQNNNQNCTNARKNVQLSNSCEIIENKLAISNDDLLEAIEQLSMLSKSRDICATPKRNNSERDNAKSNEAKADKERKELEEEDRRKYIEFLQNEKLHILGNMDALKRSVADIEIQEEEISRELELEKALLSAEYESESLKLTQDEGEKIRIQMRINELEREMAEDTSTQANFQADAKHRVQRAQQFCNRLEEELANCEDEMMQQELMEKLAVQQDILESERKAFEDLEFHHLEEEASKLATREELQRYLSELSCRIESRKAQLNHLESQRSQANNTATKDTRSLERQKLGHMRRLEEGRNRLRAIDDELENLAQNSIDNSEEKRSPSREDFDRISRVTTDSPIVNNQGSLGRKTIESLKEIERNRQLHLAKQGSQVISEERRRVEELKRRVQDEVRSQWEERKMNCASFNSVESGEESSSYSTGPTER